MSDFDRSKQFGYQVGFDLIKEGKQYLEITTTGDRHTFPFACPAEVGVAQFATDLIARMIPEIERLREWGRGEQARASALQQRIEELEANDLVESQLKEIQSLNERIEELEKESEWKAMKQLLCADYHIITTDQLRAAWEMIRALRHIDTKTSRIAANALEDLLEKFGIETCEGCGGIVNQYLKERCPRYDGEGWMVKDE